MLFQNNNFQLSVPGVCILGISKDNSKKVEILLSNILQKTIDVFAKKGTSFPSPHLHPYCSNVS
jgi:hypothetical protein